MLDVFEPVPSPFGIGNDESATQEAFINFIGGYGRADRLQYMHRNSYPACRTFWMDRQPTKEATFRRKALAEGFTTAEIDAYLSL